MISIIGQPRPVLLKTSTNKWQVLGSFVQFLETNVSLRMCFSAGSKQQETHKPNTDNSTCSYKFALTSSLQPLFIEKPSDPKPTSGSQPIKYSFLNIFLITRKMTS